MRIVIDYQGAQTGGSRTRGIGRYTTSITRALIAEAEGAEVVILLNAAFADTIEPIRADLERLLPPENIVVWRPLHPIAHIVENNADRRKTSELLREAVLARLKPDILLITSHFEGSGDDGATTIGMLPAIYPTAVVLYDLIPYIYRSIYLANPAVERWYEERIGSLKRADLLLTISESSRQEAIDYLGYPAERAVNISTAADSHFCRAELENDQRKELLARYGITRPFVMYTGGIDHRKNIEGLIRAYSMLPESIRRKHQLAVVCSMRPEDGPRLRDAAREAGIGADDLVLTGFVPEDDLVGLYSSCKLFVFPSWHEGFGLPALEAMRCGAPVIAGNRSSLPEVVGDPRALFDPREDRSIATKMRDVLSDEKLRQQLIDTGSERAALFSWELIGQRAFSAIEDAVAHSRKKNAAVSGPDARPRLAMVTPAPPAESGIANYAATLIRALQALYRIDLVLQDGAVTDDPFILANCSVISASDFRRRFSEYDRVVYQFGNSDYHTHMVDLIKECPGVLVLHDFFVSGLSSWREHLGGVEGNWGFDLYESHGIGALLERHCEPDLAAVINKYPCSYAISRHALSVICHSQEAKQLQIQWHGEESARDWRVVPMIRPKPRLPARAAARRELGLGEDEYVVCAYGILGRSKLNHRLIEAWASSQVGRSGKARLVFVGGYGAEDYFKELRSQVASHDKSKVEFSGWVDEQTYWRYLAAADVAVQLRGLTHGETSAATLDAMLAALPVIANRSAALPEEAAGDAIAYIPAEAPVDSLASALDELHRDTKLRSRLGETGCEYATNNHSESNCGRRFAEAVEHAYRTSMVTLNAAVDSVADLTLSEEEASAVADELALAMDQRRKLVFDITALIPQLPLTYRDTLGRVLLGLARKRPTLRVVAVASRSGGYQSAMDVVRRAALQPHIHDVPETVLLKSVDLLVSFDSADVALAKKAAAESGASHLELTSDTGFDPDQMLKRILKFVDSNGRSPTSIARHFQTSSAVEPPQSTSLRSPSRKRGKGRKKELAGS